MHLLLPQWPEAHLIARPSSRLAATVAIALSSLSASARLQQKSAAPSGPTIHVTSRETVVDVIVTDANGQPIHGLTQGDFTVKEDGKPQAIRSFRETGTEGPAVARALPKLPPNVYTNAESVPASGPANVILLDFLHTDWPNRVYMKRAAVEYLKAMPQGQGAQVAVFAWWPAGFFRLIQGFTSDGGAAAASVDALDVVGNQLPASNSGAQVEKDAAMEVMNHIASYVAGIKGRKNLLWFTQTIPFNCLKTTDQEVARLFGPLTEAQTAVYPVDPHGVFNSPAVTVVPGGGPPNSQMGFLYQTGCNQTLMEAVAEQTGGTAYYNTNSLTSAVGKAFDNGSHYYTLSYVPPPFANDGRYHAIDIKLNRPDLHLTYRKGFNADEAAPTAPASGPRLTQASMGPGTLPATQLLFDIRVAPTPQPGPENAPVPNARRSLPGKSSIPYDLLYFLPQSQIAFSDAPDGTHTGSLEFDIAAYDPDNKLVAIRSQTMNLPLTAEEYQEFIKTPFQFLQQLDLPSGQLTLRVGILDGISKKVGTLEIPLTVAKPTASIKAATVVGSAEGREVKP
jgi:VWFA-related protein